MVFLIAQRPERYVELTQAKNQIQQRALPLAELEQYNPKTDVEKTLAKYPKADAWLPLKANAVDMVVLVNKESASYHQNSRLKTVEIIASS